jgi:GGDEF domain-containing protein
VLAGRTHEPSASIGVALFPLASDQAHDLLRLADDAMYCAKRAGGSRIFVDAGEGPREIV